MPMEYFEARERALLGARYDALYTPLRQSAERGVTVSALRCAPETFAAQADFAMEPSPFCPQGFRVLTEGFKPGRHPYHHAGVFYSQEPSASSAAPLLGVAPGMRVLDLCAAPGGKSSQLAAALMGQGLLVSNEYVAARADILKSNLERMGVSNAVVLNETPARIAAAYPAFFDRILVDTPCSGEGMFRKEAVAVTQHSPELVAQCAALGADILEAAAAALAPGGVLVYSTCTFAPEEDEAQIGRFLSLRPEFTLLDTMQGVAQPFGSAGEANRVGDTPYDVALTRRIWPCQGGEGHFIAKLQKAGQPRSLPAMGEVPTQEASWLADAIASTSKAGKGGRKGQGAKAAIQTENPRATRRGGREDAHFAGGRGVRTSGKAAHHAGGQVLSGADALGAWQAFAAEYFPTLAAKSTVLLGESLLLPAPYPQAKLRILRAGVFAGNVAKGRFTPEHHLFTAFGALCINQEHLTLTDPRTAIYLAGGEIQAITAQNGWCCVLVDGYPLGGGKVSGGRVKNHYPKALRNLK
ncbi:MAG: RsmF rRNA methyltransferase first C-terminal domain-containing protein [Faecalibacterium sp.]